MTVTAKKRRGPGARTPIHRGSIIPLRRLTDDELDAMQAYGDKYAPGDEMATRILHAVQEIRDTRETLQYRDDNGVLPRLFQDVLERAVSTDGYRRMRWIQEIVAEEHDMTLEDMFSEKRTRWWLWPRQIAMRLCREVLNMPLKAIGIAFQRHHATVVHALQKSEPRFLEHLARVREAVESELPHRVEEHRRALGLPARKAAPQP